MIWKSLAEVFNKSKLLEKRVLASYNMKEKILFF